MVKEAILGCLSLPALGGEEAGSTQPGMVREGLPWRLHLSRIWGCVGVNLVEWRQDGVLQAPPVGERMASLGHSGTSRILCRERSGARRQVRLEALWKSSSLP